MDNEYKEMVNIHGIQLEKINESWALIKNGVEDKYLLKVNKDITVIFLIRYKSTTRIYDKF